MFCDFDPSIRCIIPEKNIPGICPHINNGISLTKSTIYCGFVGSLRCWANKIINGIRAHNPAIASARAINVMNFIHNPIRFSLIKRIHIFVLNVSKTWVFLVRLFRDLASLFLSGKTQPIFYGGAL